MSMLIEEELKYEADNCNKGILAIKKYCKNRECNRCSLGYVKEKVEVNIGYGNVTADHYSCKLLSTHPSEWKDEWAEDVYPRSKLERKNNGH